LRASHEWRRVIGSNGKITPPPMLLSDRYLLVLLDHQCIHSLCARQISSLSRVYRCIMLKIFWLIYSHFWYHWQLVPSKDYGKLTTDDKPGSSHLFFIVYGGIWWIVVPFLHHRHR
jgi:hypothetical protein